MNRAGESGGAGAGFAAGVPELAGAAVAAEVAGAAVADVPDAIVACARELRVEVVIMGKHHLGFVEHMLAVAAWRRQDWERVRELTEHSLALARGRFPNVETGTYWLLGQLALADGDVERAVRAVDQVAARVQRGLVLEQVAQAHRDQRRVRQRALSALDCGNVSAPQAPPARGN